MSAEGAAGPLGASFRDPSGYLFEYGGELYRQVNQPYRPHYERLMESGLYEALTADHLLIPHEAVEDPRPGGLPPGAFTVLRPERVAFISYPYEWSFSQFKDAALATLKIQMRALESGMSLKDSSVYNIQFVRGRPALIDSLSFELYREGSPWVAYRQFCQHFLMPLSLMARRDIALGKLMRVHLDGIPLDLGRKLLPATSLLSPALLVHIHLHANSQKRYAWQDVRKAAGKMSLTALRGLVDSLRSAVEGLRWQPQGTEWADYYEIHNYTPAGIEHKEQLVGEYLDRAKPGMVWDLGANVGRFSRLASERGAFTVAFDADPAAVERNYLDAAAGGEDRLLPLVMDLTNPSPALGWSSRERMSLLERGPAGLVMALALVHHLAISNNVPLDRLADFFARLGRWLIVEFVPKSDSQVRRLLASREDIFPDYTPAGFEQAFARRFTIHRSESIRDSERKLYWMERK